MSEYNNILFSVDGAIARISLNRPDAANGMNLALTTELAQAAAACDSNPAIRAVILSAEGRFFSAGGDVKSMAALGDGVPAGIKAIADELHKAISVLQRMRAPLIVAVNGVAAGAGFSLAVTGSLVLAGESAAFTMAYSKVGLSPDGSSSYFLPRLIGMRKTQELMLTNRMLKANEALEWGLVNKVVPDNELQTEATKLAELVVQASPDSNAAIKRLLTESFDNGLETQMELEGRMIKDCAGSANGREGITAFVEKRTPVYTTS